MTADAGAVRRTSDSARPAGSFGVDAPWVPWLFVALAAAYVVFGFLASPWWVALIVFLIAAAFAAAAALYWHTTARGKFVVWRDALAAIPEPAPARGRHVAAEPGEGEPEGGPEGGPADRILDLGCGRGAVAIQAALRFPRARVDGIDLWRSRDQSGNSPDVSRRNAELNRVADRIEFTTGDMTQLPWGDGTFGLVTASVSIHNIPSAAGREQAVREAWRVLSPGGRMVVADIRRTGEYEHWLRALGAVQVERHGIGWRMWWSGPWMATSLLKARKPEA